MPSEYAPIVFFAYNRPDHTRQALASLKRCPESSATPVTVYVDGPKSEEGAPAVEATRTAVREAAPSHARIVCREENFGLANSIMHGVTEHCDEHGRVIVVEDDLVLSPAALTYFNDALRRYIDDERVMHIAGYWPKTRLPVPPSFFLRWPSVWGWATWDRAWQKLEPDLDTLKRTLEERGLVDAFNAGGWNLMDNLQGTIDGDYDSWGIRWYASVIIHGGLALHPGQSLVGNTGTDGSGVHYEKTNAYRVHLADSAPPFPEEVAESKAAVDAFADFIRRKDAPPSLPRRILRRSVRLIRRLLRPRLGAPAQ